MSLDASHGRHTDSPPSSGRSSPVPRATRRTVEDGLYKADKSLKRYAANIERALASWEIAPEEWADYIAFLGRLLKAIQTHPKDAPILPHSNAIATRLAQCLNPALPSGVHQKALDVYTYVFATFGNDHIASQLHEYLPGLAAVLSFASLNVRPGLYGLFEAHVVALPASDLRPALKSIILSLLPALEEENSEDFERAFSILQALETRFAPPSVSDQSSNEVDGYFWQCLFLAIITSPSRRQGALSFLSRKLPRLVASPNDATTNAKQLSKVAQCVVSPEPGLLTRSFVCGLSDGQVLIQRSFLDLLVTHLPLDSPVLQVSAGDVDLDRLVSAATQVLLRRDMSLNRRLWSWFLGPEPKEKDQHSRETSPALHRNATQEERSNVQLRYFSTFGKSSLQRGILKMLESSAKASGQKARPFRVCLSLMDRWEIGGLLVPEIFLPAMRSLHEYSLTASPEDLADVVRSANLFFDGVEASLIWESLITLIQKAFENATIRDLDQFEWIIRTFNVKDEEMLTTHIPYATLYLLASIDARAMPIEFLVRATTVATRLAEMIPARVFQSKPDTPSDIDPMAPSLSTTDIRLSITGFYSGDQRLVSQFKVISQPRTLFYLLAISIMQELENAAINLDARRFSSSSGLLVLLFSKGGRLTELATEVLDMLSSTLERGPSWSRNIPFPILSSTVSLITCLSGNGEGQDLLRQKISRVVAPDLVSHIWQNLSPEAPKYHVEAVKAFWQFEELLASEDEVVACLSGLVRDDSTHPSGLSESFRRFGVLWGHTIAPGASKVGSSRRGSAMSVLVDSQQQIRAQRILEVPLLLVLDALASPSDPVFEVVKSWLSGLASLDHLFEILFSRLVNSLSDAMRLDDSTPAISRRKAEELANLDYVLVQIQHIIQHGNGWTWQCLTQSTPPSAPNGGESSGLIWLADTCIRMLCNPGHTSEPLNRRLISLLALLLDSPAAVELKSMDLESALIERLMECVSGDMNLLQSALLRLVQLSLKLRFMTTPEQTSKSRKRGASLSTRRASLAFDSRPPTSASSSSTVTTPPSQLFQCLQLGFSSTRTHYHLDQWLVFLADVLPTISDTIFTNLLPLVECFSNQLQTMHTQMASLSRKGNIAGGIAAPETVAMYLLDGLEMTLDRAYECLMIDAAADSTTKEQETKPSFLGNAMSGVFKADGAPNKASKSNSRLTVVLALQDTIRVTLRMWLWASSSSNTNDFDTTSSATTAYNALKVRNKTRHLLEQIFSVEPLESLEVIIAHWCNAGSDAEASSALSLLHVMHVSRPKNVVPATLDALCTRTNPSSATVTRNSSLTLDMSPSDVATFFSAYLDSTEDDAMDEVWPDCVAFLRDVLANPLPHRQVLPHLLSIILLLAEKLNNTNFGEQRKMRRDLGDIFQRLLTATFTTLPSGYVAELAKEDVASNGDKPSRHADIEHSMTLIPVLKRVVGKLDFILESSDRMAIAINNIATNLLATTFKARSFPKNVNQDLLELIVQMTRKAPTAKTWKKEVGDAFNDIKLLYSPEDIMVQGWFPVLHQFSLYDKERMPELLSRLAPPASAGIMFGVGASAARLDADRKTQYNLRRICLLLLASPENTYVAHLRTLEEKIAELFEATLSSSPSAAIKAELFMLCRALALSVSAWHLSPLWPIINDKMQAALMSLLPSSQLANDFNNLSLFQACKLLDLLIALSPDEFQLHEWLYITDTIDAVYQPFGWTPSALSDQVAEQLNSTGDEEGTAPEILSVAKRRPLLGDELPVDQDDIKALPRDEFIRAVLKPFLSQLSLHAYEGVYSMEQPDVEGLRRNLLEDLLDVGSVVE